MATEPPTPDGYEPGTTIAGHHVHYVDFDTDDPRSRLYHGDDRTACSTITTCEPTDDPVDCQICLRKAVRDNALDPEDPQ